VAVSSYPAIARSRNLSSKRFECNGLVSSFNVGTICAGRVSFFEAGMGEHAFRSGGARETGRFATNLTE